MPEVFFPSRDVNPDSDSDPQSEPQLRARRHSGTRLRGTSLEHEPSEPSAASQPAASRSAIARPIGIEIDDTELARRMITDEGWAKEAFYRKHVEQAYRVARRLVRNSADAEDIVQEAFSQAFRDIEHLREPAKVRGWFMRIVVNRAHRKFRRRNLLRIFGLDKSTEDSLDRVTSSDLCAESRTELALANRVLEQASLAARTAWLLRHVEGYTLPEAALATDCSLATVKRRISEVNQLLETHLALGSGNTLGKVAL